MTGRAKWDAWSSAGKTFVQREDAERRYLEIARSLGWAEDMVVQKPRDEVTRSDSWEEDGSVLLSSNSGAGGGMGGAVSVMLPPVQEPDESIHGFAISNDASALSALLEANPATNVDELDEFVSLGLFHTCRLTGPQGYTPLHLACDRGNLAVVQILLNKGADAAIKVWYHLVKFDGREYWLL
jgi:Ankyrin repeat